MRMRTEDDKLMIVCMRVFVCAHVADTTGKRKLLGQGSTVPARDLENGYEVFWFKG